MKLFTRPFFRYGSQHSQVLSKVKLFQHKMYTLVPPPLQELDSTEKHNLQELVGNFFADFQKIKVSRIGLPSSQKTPGNSLVSMTIPLSSEKLVQSALFRYDNQLRIGKLMEFLDLFAGYIGYKHIQQDDQSHTNKTLVTACVDNVEFFADLTTTNDITLTGYVTYVGHSSIEVQIDIYQKSSPTDTEAELVGTSMFLMVARSKDGTQAAQVPKLILEDDTGFDSSSYRYQQGIRNQKTRKTKRQISFASTEPTSEESKLLHQFFVKPLNYLDHTPIEQTQTKDTSLSQFEDRNIHNKIFGGYLMRRMIETGWLCGFLHLKGVSSPKMVYLSDIQFYSPVEIGSILGFTSHVCYTTSCYMDVKITVEIVNPSDRRQNKITTDMHLILQADREVNPVVPRHYEHGVLYLEGKRVLQAFLQEQ